MSVCFFVPADQNAANAEEAEVEGCEENKAESAEQTLQQFWTKVIDDIKNVSPDDFKTQPLPLTRIKKIMKLDEDVKMISAEAPVLFAKAAEIFIHELTLRAWSHTEDNKRRTLQRNDIAMAISKSDQFDFLIDIVPRHEVKPAKQRFEAVWSKSNNEQVSHQHQAATLTATTPQQQIVLQPGCAQVIQTSSSTSPSSVQQPVTLVQQVVTPQQDVQTIPSQIQLTQAQLNMIRLQVQNNPSQPIIIQAQPQQSPQIIQENLAGWTPLHIAAQCGHVSMAAHLRERCPGVEARALDFAGRTPRRLARRGPAAKLFQNMSDSSDSESDEDDDMYDSDNETLFSKLVESYNPTVVA